jgi:Leu/Phe-tRNA-protein transferase
MFPVLWKTNSLVFGVNGLWLQLIFLGDSLCIDISRRMEICVVSIDENICQAIDIIIDGLQYGKENGLALLEIEIQDHSALIRNIQTQHQVPLQPV